jgi:geranylgeranyl diphosphate synthase type II
LAQEYSIADYINSQSEDINGALHGLFYTHYSSQEVLAKVMGYTLFAQGKRLRALLLLEAFRLFAQPGEDGYRLSLVMELVHAASLIHDDLPSMDNDEMRRGQPSSHIQFGEQRALLAGDAFFVEPFRWLGQLDNQCYFTELVKELSYAMGIPGIMTGQAMDLDFEKRSTINIKELQEMHERKTGALIVAALRMGLWQGYAQMRREKGGDSSTSVDFQNKLAALSRYGKSLGLLFQITDDILDYVGDEEHLGKPVGSDAKRGKKTYVSLLGLRKAKRLAEKELGKCQKIASRSLGGAMFFQKLPEFIYYRNK